MRSARRSNAQLQKTSATRKRVFDFMARFPSQHQWTMDGPPDTEIDEIICFAYDGGSVFVATWWHGGWALLTEPSSDGDLDVLERAMRLQIEERQRGTDAPLSGMWVMKMLEGMIPRMSDETLKQASDLFDTALSDNKAATEVRIPVAGMTPDGFEEGLSPEDDAVLFATGHLPEDF